MNSYQENTWFNKEHSKDFQKHNQYKRAREEAGLIYTSYYRVVEMKPDDVIAKVEEFGIKISRSTLLNYEKWGLIPEPSRGGAGRGKGRTTDYSDETPTEAYASYRTIHDDKLSVRPKKLGEIINIHRQKGDTEPIKDDDDDEFVSKAHKFCAQKDFDSMMFMIWIQHKEMAQLKTEEAQLSNKYEELERTFKERIERETNIKINTLRIILEGSPINDERIKRLEFLEKRVHGDVRATRLETKKIIFEQWDAQKNEWILLDFTIEATDTV